MNKLAELTSSYILKCDEIIKAKDIREAEKLQDIIISTYGDYIKGIKDELDNYSGLGFYDHRAVDFLGDMIKLKAKLEMFIATECRPTKGIVDSPSKGLININNNNHNSNNNENTNNNKVDISILFDETRKEIENNESLSEEEIKEVLEKIKEIEDISKLEENKNKKWFKLRPTMEWLGTKGVSVATAVLGLITAILKM